jgi:hypothetical protein
MVGVANHLRSAARNKMADRTHDSFGRPIVREAGKEYVLLPGTKRPDGSVRAGKKVKPDYMPQDEMATYGSQVGLGLGMLSAV